MAPHLQTRGRLRLSGTLAIMQSLERAPPRALVGIWAWRGAATGSEAAVCGSWLLPPPPSRAAEPGHDQGQLGVIVRGRQESEASLGDHGCPSPGWEGCCRTHRAQSPALALGVWDELAGSMHAVPSHCSCARGKDMVGPLSGEVTEARGGVWVSAGPDAPHPTRSWDAQAGRAGSLQVRRSLLSFPVLAR